MPSLDAVRWTRRAISPLLAIITDVIGVIFEFGGWEEDVDVDVDEESRALDAGRKGRRLWAFLMDLMVLVCVCGF